MFEGGQQVADDEDEHKSMYLHIVRKVHAEDDDDDTESKIDDTTNYLNYGFKRVEFAHKLNNQTTRKVAEKLTEQFDD